MKKKAKTVNGMGNPWHTKLVQLNKLLNKFIKYLFSPRRRRRRLNLTIVIDSVFWSRNAIYLMQIRSAHSDNKAHSTLAKRERVREERVLFTKIETITDTNDEESN